MRSKKIYYGVVSLLLTFNGFNKMARWMKQIYANTMKLGFSHFEFDEAKCHGRHHIVDYVNVMKEGV